MPIKNLQNYALASLLGLGAPLAMACLLYTSRCV